MGKKLNFNELKAQMGKSATFDTIEIKLGDENYDVKIDTSFQYSKLDEMFKWVGENEQVLSIIDDEKVLSVLLILRFLTDVEMGEDISDNLNAIAALSEAGVMADVINAVPEKVLQEYIDGLLKMTKQIELGMKKYKKIRK